jgi:hypothetical protein
MSLSNEEREALQKEQNTIYRQLREADEGKGPAIGDKLREQLTRRVDMIENALTPQEREYNDVPRSPWKGFDR